MRGQILSLWNLLDPIYYNLSRLTYVSTDKGVDNIFRIRLTKYRGRNVILSDGTEIKRNDTLIKIHLHNVRLLKELKDIKSELKKAKIIYRHVQNSLPGVETYIRQYYDSHNIKGIIGITLLNKGCERLGFEVIDIINPFYKWYKTLTFLPIGLLSHQGATIHQFLKYQKPNYLFMSKDKLTELYGDKWPIKSGGA